MDQPIELRLAVPLQGDIKSMVVRKSKGDLRATVLDADTGKPLCHIPLESLNNLG